MGIYYDAFERYFIISPIQNSTTLQPNTDKAFQGFQNSTEKSCVEFQESLQANTNKACRVVEFQMGGKDNIQHNKA